ncbi:DUF2905 domain-containing protein [Hyphococcus flavus]|uniref:DUF2905 domain-containing protein n=2 Tax=Hyphococcus flavus TaxID=1866326 RepID=A0AAE9ZD84_9PROT|nr:DUF2905 domain-containing protein [Hyphococcus flavus]WDI32873.1 DUF2905 domain-containing protein [Hyphococcus flavus]
MFDDISANYNAYMQKLLITIGIVLLVTGLLWPVLSKLGLGRLPGDIVIRREGFSLYFPVTTMIIISIVLTLIFRFFGK